MTSTDLLRIVGAMTGAVPDPLDCPLDVCVGAHDPRTCPWLLGTSAKDRAREGFANHATALVELVRACEHIAELRPSGLHATMERVDIMLSRLAAVHAVQP